MEKILLFGLADTELYKIKQIASRIKLSCEQIAPARYGLTLGEIASGSVSAVPSDPIPAPPSIPAGSLLVMCGLSDKRMDKLLFELRRADVKLDYKAVLTQTNSTWTLPRLMLEMQKEKAFYTHMGKRL